jgi:asparagine synthase (glutamine-hydrolysing)
MCGIAGIVRFDSKTSVKEVRSMTDALIHRGPDGEGAWLNATENVGLGHRRLAIIDLSPLGHQPMISEDHRFVITFNGEIYNYIELRENLKKEGHVFRTENDTEVLLKLFQLKGAACLHELDGMFAFAIWDNDRQELFCARDRFGEKPIYYFLNNSFFTFASEMKAIWKVNVPCDMNFRMAYNYEFFGYKTNPADPSETFFENIYSLPAGHYLTLKKRKLTIQKYYSIQLLHNSNTLNLNEVREQVQDLMRQSITRRLRGQVAVGSSFSGGLDSSIIVTEIEKILNQRNQRLNVFSAIFPGFEKNEEKFIQKLLAGKNVTPHFILPDKAEYENVVNKLYYNHEEPFTSSSVLAQYFIYKKAREKNVIVLLDGQGADEVFGGYHGYYHTYFKSLYQTNKSEWKKQWSAYQVVNKGNAINQTIHAGRFKQVVLSNFLGLLNYKRQRALEKSIDKSRYLFYKSHLKEKFEIRSDFKNLTEELHYQTFNIGLPALLRYADRNSMASSVEIRLPFLDHKIVELLFSLPDSYKINDGWTKWLLRSVYQDVLPKEICWRKDKIGLESSLRIKDDTNRKSVLDTFQKVSKSFK